MHLGRLDHIGMLVEDLETTRGFLETVLGFEERKNIEREDLRAVFLTSGDVTIELFWLRDEAERAAQLGGAERRLDHLALSVADLAAAVEELADAGVETTPPFDTGEYLTTFADPATADGIKYQFVQYTQG